MLPINYQFVPYNTSPPEVGSFMYEYLVGSPGVFIRAHRKYLQVSFIVAEAAYLLKGLEHITGYFVLDGRVPLGYISAMFKDAFLHKDIERLYWGIYKPTGWKFLIPEQDATPGSVKPRNPFSMVGRDALIEVHSHNGMGAGFSPTDDMDEVGFRIYTVIGKVNSSQPEILTRVGVYGHFWTIRSNWVYELPAYVRDVGFEQALYMEVQWT